jgi:hypothetical protein
MKKLLGLLTVVALATSVATAEENSTATQNNVGKIGYGYQGIVTGEFLQGLSARSWLKDSFGMEATIYHAMVNIDVDDESVDGNIFMGELKFMHALKINNNSKFYAGLGAGYGSLWSSEGDENIDVFWVRPLIGSEYFFQEFPELGFNFEVGYGYTGAAVSDVDVSLIGINVALGAHYYF